MNNENKILNDLISNIKFEDDKIIFNRKYYEDVINTRIEIINNMIRDLKNKQHTYKESLEDLKMINDYKEENYPVAYHHIKGQLDIINYIIETFFVIKGE